MASVRDPSADLRRRLRDARRGVSVGERLAAADAVARGLLALSFAPTRGYVAGYWAVDGEVPLHAWQLRLPKDCVYCLPVLDESDNSLCFAPFCAGDATRPNRFGIPEPVLEASSLLSVTEMALIVLPLTGFDASGHRLGMGGGWYDRTLRDHRGAPPHLVGIGFDCQRVDAIQPREWDVPCDAIVTESTTYLREST
ncbi:5-formyltetrahydrofolate cyclo-ligase [Solilutibacter silvestris]|uniref:5-formyltetrahydrofolate cyclo-ligase n=1 Tax=Solilutibacter silvestris TaxID=1645665 RepID=A0A2K1Q200_9GAMM|nr:5-formyltetrahydrofolate cyclo-ligase [Lysobacter silvestris]PNS09059.1 5-formyltetrahydrofolate cyclo-ligase [Lysobacter silvestris]